MKIHSNKNTGTHELDLNDDTSTPLPIAKIPTIYSVGKISDVLVLDLTHEEE